MPYARPPVGPMTTEEEAIIRARLQQEMAARQDMVGNPMGGGMLDPRSINPEVSNRYGIMAQRGDEYDAQLAGLADHKKEEGFFKNTLSQGLPAILAMAATGGAAGIPLALAYAIGAGSKRTEENKDFNRMNPVKVAGSRFDLSGSILDESQESFGVPGSRRVATQRTKVFDPDTNKYFWHEFDPNGGGWKNTGLIADPNEPDDPDGLVGEFLEAKRRGIIGPDETLQDYVDNYKKRPSSTIAAIDAVTDSRVPQGTEIVSSAETRGTEKEQRFAGLRQARDELNLNVLPQLGMIYEDAERMLQQIEAGDFQGQIPVLGQALAGLLPDLAEMQQYAAGEALQNLQITNLAPVTEKELEFIQTMAANPAAWSDAVNIRRLRGTLRKIENHKRWLEGKLGYISRELGESEPPAPMRTPAPTPDPFADLSPEARALIEGQ